ncbi:MAG: winged helix-turn-helix domain-containing protein [Litoreibacter sp.]|nr:winged helix-turn-helix domain-containing protein [Litoreibacter sp.]
MNNPVSIAIVEDDPEIGPMTRDRLIDQGFDAHLVTDRTSLDALLARHVIDLIVLDLMLPGEDGLSICRRLRAQSDIPILMLTARTEEIDRVVGLELGADDYLGKPFGTRELVARIRAILRRAEKTAPPKSDLVRFADIEVDLARHAVRLAGAELVLTSGEFALLRAFLTHPGRVLSRDQLMDFAQGRQSDHFDRTIDVQISRLRSKLGDDPRSPQFIKTIRNAGYVFAAELTS